MTGPMTTLRWSCRSQLENTSMCTETWMMMASMKVILELCLYLLFAFPVFIYKFIFGCF